LSGAKPMPERQPILVTGAAGFLGFHVARRLLVEGRLVVGVDNLDPYYDPRLKLARLAELAPFTTFHWQQIDLADRGVVAALFGEHRFPCVVHLAGQAGVRYSLTEPHAYARSNLLAFLNVLEGCRHNGCRHLLYASSSSVYGANLRIPFATSDHVDHPLSLYGATKKANELMAHAYAHLFALPATGLRFFTVYGPWGRPDMAVWLFTAAILENRPIRLFNNGRMRRDFTYVDDAVEAVVRLIERPAAPDRAWDGENPDPATSQAPWRVYNIGNSRPVRVLDLVSLIEAALGCRGTCEFAPMQPGDVPETCADIAPLAAAIGFSPATPIEEGVRRFASWYQAYAARGV
jgi:UDP-glucuronate 4-epimerase